MFAQQCERKFGGSPLREGRSYNYFILTYASFRSIFSYFSHSAMPNANGNSHYVKDRLSKVLSVRIEHYIFIVFYIIHLLFARYAHTRVQ